ncbi:DUF4381 domain-containing protein [Pseudomonas gingeri]|uniref:DUF4381 domain-containing protein n=1 Tax=Pseudomonas gingeri TaxID=117681 RepID=A0A7Y7YFW7_9PSED|nr:DUF4381 domain-containing protein [Pseudomonas gingeri]NWB27946.1 DUF4381 domain-containing protein [Pseudomonas gingeri]NWC35470.1 DUF4381 domain-containing protein [Pseudomonas gingeri]NWD51428.1 DUF4381 domain-containing protein [Pseudomonas gingeri]
MNAPPSLAQLQEIPLPAPVSYWPQTWGWTVLLGLLIVGLLAWGVRRYWCWRQNRYRREALARLEQLSRRLEQPEALRELPEVLKRVALSMPGIPASTVTLLSGESWQRFLVEHGDNRLPTDFSQALAELAYAPDSRLQALAPEQRRQLFDQCRHWVEHHHVAA